MVRLFKALLPSLLLATFAAAQVTDIITQPSSTIWWVGKSENVMAWACHNLTFATFTVLIQNQDPKVLAGPLAILAIQQNYDCSITVSENVVNQAPASGYTLSFANPINITEVYTVSQPFEIKPHGSLYPSQVSSSASDVSGTATSSSPSSSSNAATLSTRNPNFLGLAGVMGLLTVGLLGA